MEKINKIGFGFNLTFSILLIVFAPFLFISSIILFVMGILVFFYLFFGLACLFLSFALLAIGILNLIFAAKNKNGEYSTIFMRIVVLLFNATIMLPVLIMLIVFLTLMSLVDIFTNFQLMFVGIYCIPFMLLSFILLLFTFSFKRSKTTKHILTIFSSVLTLPTIGALICLFFFAYQIFVFSLFGLLLVCFVVYLIIDIFKSRKSPEQKETINVSVVDETITTE